jgi:hypothetical protein
MTNPCGSFTTAFYQQIYFDDWYTIITMMTNLMDSRRKESERAQIEKCVIG